MVTEWANYSDERLVESYRQSIVATDPEFRALAEPIHDELMLRLIRGGAAYKAVQTAQASTRSTSWVCLWLLITVGLCLWGLR